MLDGKLAHEVRGQIVTTLEPGSFIHDGNREVHQTNYLTPVKLLIVRVLDEGQPETTGVRSSFWPRGRSQAEFRGGVCARETVNVREEKEPMMDRLEEIHLDEYSDSRSHNPHQLLMRMFPRARWMSVCGWKGAGNRINLRSIGDTLVQLFCLSSSCLISHSYKYERTRMGY